LKHKTIQNWCCSSSPSKNSKYSKSHSRGIAIKDRKIKKISPLTYKKGFLKLISEEENTFSLFYFEDSFTIQSQDYPRLDDGKPCKKRAVARFFGDEAETEGDCSFGLGQQGFPKEFYKDLYNLVSKDVDINYFEWVVPNVDSGESGYHTGGICLMENGLHHSFQYYKEDPDNDW